MKVIQAYDGLTPFSKNIVISLGLHLFIISIFTIKFTLFKTENIIFENAIRVDMVALPEKIKSKTAKPSKIKNKTVRLKQKKKKAKYFKKKQLKALKELKAMSALDQIKQDLINDEKNKENTNNKPKDPVFKGNIIASGDSLDGLNQLKYNKYLSEVKRRINQNFVLPAYLNNQDLKAKALIAIDMQGYIIKKEILETSNNNLFDQSVLTSIDKSSPLPQPPDRLKSLLSKNSFILSFP
ncbi:MAG: hypothetical protein HOO06_02400 [Bdellovibrionaceae bacterium]|jgi:colicin import membrane protein|nr:hypothetical protein [Pseudobdellovibrionaceae bacterium]